jgi:hypothetical protein
MSDTRFFGAESSNHRTRSVGLVMNSTEFLHARLSVDPAEIERIVNFLYCCG